MTIQIFIYGNVPDKKVFMDIIKDTIDINYLDINLDNKYDPNVRRIGFVWDNNKIGIPFGKTELIIDDYKFIYFKKELFEYIQNYSNITVDLITCYLNNSLFLSELKIIQNNLNNVNIEYSLDATGNNFANGNWIMESNNSSILNIYFNNLINNYKYILGSVSSHSAVIAVDGTVTTYGSSFEGQLGRPSLGSDIGQVTGITNAISVSCGSRHTAIVKQDGTVWTFGENTSGELGYGSVGLIVNVVPAQASIIVDAISVSCGESFTVVLKNDGTVWTFGENVYGQLGYFSNPSLVPALVPGITNAIEISCGESHTMVLKSDNTVWTFGYNQFGQLGNGSMDTSSNFVPSQVLGITDAIAISGGKFHSCIIRTDNTVWTFGNNVSGQLGNSTNINSSVPVQVTGMTDAEQVSGGSFHTAILKNDNTLWTSGNNLYGQFGNGTNIGSNIPIQATDSSGTTVDVVTGSEYTIILKDNGIVWGSGQNSDGQLGIETSINQSIFVQSTSSIINTTLMDSSFVLMMTEEMTTEEITTEQITTEQMTTDGMTTEQITTEQMMTEGMTTEQMTTEQMTTEQMTTEGMTTEQMTTEEVLNMDDGIIEKLCELIEDNSGNLNEINGNLIENVDKLCLFRKDNSGNLNKINDNLINNTNKLCLFREDNSGNLNKINSNLMVISESITGVVSPKLDSICDKLESIQCNGDTNNKLLRSMEMENEVYNIATLAALNKLIKLNGGSKCDIIYVCDKCIDYCTCK
jgi:alpha-tubulin suppressor-like RCC1 family protein